MNIPQNWTFKNSEIAASFDKHVREQLPWYNLSTGIVEHCARHYIAQDGLVYDIGASTGNIGRAIANTMKQRNARFIAIDNSQEMADIYNGPGQFITEDALKYEYEDFDFAVAFLTVMFFPVSQRKQWVRQLVSKIKPGGAFLIFDKCVPHKGYCATVMSRLALSSKKAAGVPPDEIIQKELSLSGVQRPIDWMEIIPAGSIEIFRFGDFAGWLIEGKSEQ